MKNIEKNQKFNFVIESEIKHIFEFFLFVTLSIEKMKINLLTSR
jgi:hypothetical protein